MKPLDTSLEARRRQIDAYRGMTPEERLRLADEMTTEARFLAMSGIRARSGGRLGEAEIEIELARIVLDPRADGPDRTRRHLHRG